MNPRCLPFGIFLSLFANASPADPAVEALLPVPAEVRTILDQRCVMCHGEVIDGEAEIREELNLATDRDIRETLMDVPLLLELIRDDEMPQESRLSRRLRVRPDMRERHETLLADYEAGQEKAVLLAWIEKALRAAE